MKPQPLRLVIDHYRRLRDDSVAAQARVEMELAAARRTLQTLDQYRQEQHERARNAAHDPVSTSHLLLRSRFSGKLDEAMVLQAQRIEELKRRLENFRSEVLGHQQRLKAIEMLEHRRAVAAQQKAARAEQLAADERAANAHASTLRQAAADRYRRSLQPD